MRDFLRSRVFRLGALVAVLLALYAWAGFWLAPRIIRSQAISFVRENYHRELQIGAVRVQPFWLQLEVRELAFPDSDGQPLLALRRFMVDFELSSLWHRAYVFREVIIEAPGVRTVVRPDGTVNLADLALKPANPPPPKEATTLPAIWIQSLAVSDGRLEYIDRARREPYARKFEAIAFSLKDFRTTPEGGGFHLAARSEANEQFDWKGRFQLAPQIASQGELTITALQAPGIASLIGDALPFAITSGAIDLAGEYQVALSDPLMLQLRLPKLALTGLALRAHGADADWIVVPGLELANTAVDMPAQSVAIGALTISGLKAKVWTEPDDSLNLKQLFAPAAESAATTAGAPAPAPESSAPSPAPSKPWTLQLSHLDVNGAAFDFEDRMQAPVKRFAFNPVNLHVEGASLDLTRPLPVRLDALINGHAPLKIAGTLAPDPLVADLDVSLDRASMIFLQPYVLPVADLTIRDGTVAATGKLQLRPAGGRGPQLSFSGGVTIDHFKSIDNAAREDFINFDRLQFQKLRFTVEPDALKIDRVLLRGPYARVIVSREEILNISAVLDPKAAADARQEFEERQARLASETPAEKRAREKQDKAQKDQREKDKKAQAKARANAPKQAAPAATAAAEPESFPVRVRELVIESGRMNFSDFSVPPQFTADIQDLKGTVTALSSARDSRAKVDLSGNLGEFAPVTISGELQPFEFDHYTDIALKFENIPLPLFNPYSGKFAGYNIAKGKLFTELHYLIQDRALKADHKIRIEQLEWGEATAEKGEATLPVKFATWLLKDSHGVIDLNVPVTGSLDDPKFRIGPIVWQIIKNLIVKAVSAPFKLLGSLFKGAEEAQFVDFAAGSAEVGPQTAGHLATLAKGLVEKQGIRIEVPAGVDAELDRPALVEQKLERELPGLASLPPEQQVDALTKLIRQKTGAAPRLPEPPAPPAGATRAETREQRQHAALDYLQKEARAGLAATDADLYALAVARAAAIEHDLLTDTGLDPARVFVTRGGKVSPQDGKVRFQLALQ